MEILIAKKGRLKRNRWLYGVETEEEGASETPKALTKVEVIGYWPNVEKEDKATDM